MKTYLACEANFVQMWVMVSLLAEVNKIVRSDEGELNDVKGKGWVRVDYHLRAFISIFDCLFQFDQFVLVFDMFALLGFIALLCGLL